MPMAMTDSKCDLGDWNELKSDQVAYCARTLENSPRALNQTLARHRHTRGGNVALYCLLFCTTSKVCKVCLQAFLDPYVSAEGT